MRRTFTHCEAAESSVSRPHCHLRNEAGDSLSVDAGQGLLPAKGHQCADSCIGGSQVRQLARATTKASLPVLAVPQKADEGTCGQMQGDL